MPETPETPFQAALKAALCGQKLIDVARRSGVAQSTISTWTTGGGASASPVTVFAVERALGVPPGHLSRHLGFMPVEACDEPTVDTAYAIQNDPAIRDDVDRKGLLMLYSVVRARTAD